MTAETLAVGFKHHQAGRLREAEAAYRAVLTAEPAHAEATHLLGVLTSQTGDHAGAAALIARAIALAPRRPDFHANLGTMHVIAGRLTEAAACFEHALVLEPELADAHNNLGIVLTRLGRPAEAEHHYRATLARSPDSAPAWSNLANVLVAQGKFADAVAAAERAVALEPRLADAYVNLSNALTALARFDEAASACRRALALRPDLAEAHGNLGNALAAQDRLEEAIACFSHAVALRPDYAEAYMNLGNALAAHGRPDEAAACYRKLLALRPDHAQAGSNLIFALDFDPGTSSAEAFAERRRWNDRHARPLAARIVPHDNDRDPDRRLRIGYVSADFRRHSAPVVFGPVVLAHDRDHFDVVYYAGVTRPDDVTARFREAATLWRDVAGLDDVSLARIIRDDRIDILVDLSGHSRDHRLLVFAMKPAPVQVTAWGHACGTGLDAMDYFFADRVTVPPERRRDFSEEIIDLPAFVAYEPPEPAPDLGPLPALDEGVVTFGCFNRPAKLGSEVLALWAEILSALPGSRLLMKFHGLDRPPAQRRIRDAFEGHGIAAERIRFLGGSPRPDHVAAYRLVDLGLDPLPHGAGVTALDGLWMGVPLVTLCGERIPARMGASFLTTLGLTDFIATTPEDYVALAVGHAKNVARLADLRATLRGRMAASALGDHRAYCRAVESAYRAMWRRWCATR